MSYRTYALQLAVINLVFLTVLTGTYAYIELSGLEIEQMTYVIIQLTAALNMSVIVSVAGYLYLTDDSPAKPWEGD